MGNNYLSTLLKDQQNMQGFQNSAKGWNMVGTPLFKKEVGGGVIFKAFEIRGGGSDFSHKKGGVGKIG